MTFRPCATTFGGTMHLPRPPGNAMIDSSSQGGFTMIDTCVLHDDYEGYASYLGVDYDDYYQLIYNLPDEDEIEIEYPLSV